MGKLLLIPWHIGDLRDVTLRSLETVRRLRLLVAEHPGQSLLDLSRVGVDASGKDVRQLVDAPDDELLELVLGALEREDVGVLSSGGMPCFIDPGAWLVAAVRRRGGQVAALPGASVLPLAIALSGEDVRLGWGCVTVVYPIFTPDGRLDPKVLRKAADRGEPAYFFPNVEHLGRCIEILAEAVPQRKLTAFFDLTKPDRARFPMADAAVTMTCALWFERRLEYANAPFTEVALALHPAPRGRSPA